MKPHQKVASIFVGNNHIVDLFFPSNSCGESVDSFIFSHLHPIVGAFSTRETPRGVARTPICRCGAPPRARRESARWSPVEMRDPESAPACTRCRRPARAYTALVRVRRPHASGTRQAHPFALDMHASALRHPWDAEWVYRLRVYATSDRWDRL